MTIINNCPCCGSAEYTHYITCKDFTVSGETFKIVSCNSCGFKFTNPRPEDGDLGRYYKSEDYISHTNTSKGLISKLYHLVRSYTLKKKLELICKYVSRGTILDYGCGTGMFLNKCQTSGWKVYGVEPDGGARKIASGMNLSVYSDINALKPAVTDVKFNAITLWHVLEHVTNLEETLTFFQTSLAPGGALIIAVPNYLSFDAHYYKEFWAAYDVPRHLYHFDITSVSKLMGVYGFKLIDTHPMKFDSFYVSMLSEKYKTGSISYFKAFITGLKSNLAAKHPKDYSSVIYVFKKAE